MKSVKHCAYNQTRECFLGLDVSVADIPHSGLKGQLSQLVLKSGEGLWVLPFRGMPAAKASALVPVDLIYLDADCRVMEIAESLVVCPASPLVRAASVLALPTHAIYSSQTQPGDQLVICEPAEMQRRIEELCAAGGIAGAGQDTPLVGEASSGSGSSGLEGFRLVNRIEQRMTDTQQLQKESLVKPARTPFKSPRSWLARWWSPDPRRAPRMPTHGLAAYFWTGASPAAQSIRDISSTGLYLVTKESWYLDTLVLMTLQKTDCGEDVADRSISVHSRAVRWGHDGVGLQFVLSGAHGHQAPDETTMGAADRKSLDRFLRSLREGRS
jgi:uncharacterized membrane protein (UPF0127 family)